MDKIESLNKLKNTIESMEKHHQIEILKILSKNLCKINENKSGVYVNMTYLEDHILKEMSDYLKYVKEQEENLITTEYQKEEFKNSYFNQKDNKDISTITYSIVNS